MHGFTKSNPAGAGSYCHINGLIEFVERFNLAGAGNVAGIAVFLITDDDFPPTRLHCRLAHYRAIVAFASKLVTGSNCRSWRFA